MQAQRSAKRVGKELKKITANPPPHSKVELKSKDELLIWVITMQGPAKSPYEKGFFKIELDLRSDYPFKPPKVTFLNKIYHPNINREDGKVCEDLIGKDWSPQTQITNVLETIHTMLGTPDGDNPVDEAVCEEFKTDYKKFVKNATEWTKKYAKK